MSAQEHGVLTWEAHAKPGQEKPDETFIFRSGDRERAFPGPLLAALGELGANHWEMVSTFVLETAIFNDRRGYSNVAAPVGMTLYFKRNPEFVRTDTTFS